MDSKLALYIVKRVLLAIFTIFLVITITFFVMKAIPGGPFLSEKSPSAAVTAALQAKYGLGIRSQHFMANRWENSGNSG